MLQERDNLQGSLRAAQLKTITVEKEIDQLLTSTTKASKATAPQDPYSDTIVCIQCGDTTGETSYNLHFLLDGLLDPTTRGEGGDLRKRVGDIVAEIEA